MKSSTILAVVSSAVLASAQYSYNSKSNSFTCSTNGLAAYCAGGSIIIRCDDGIGLAGNCNDNLAGEPPVSASVPAGCYQSSATAGDAACTKGGLVYPASGSGASSAAPYPIPGSIVPQVVNASSSSSSSVLPAKPSFYNVTIQRHPDGTAIGYHAHSTGYSNSTFTTHYKWSNATAAGTTVTVKPTVTVTVPCSSESTSTTKSTAIVVPQPATTAHTTTPATTTTSTSTKTTTSTSSSTTSTTSSASASTTVEASTGGASALNAGSFAIVAAVALGIVF